MNKLVLILSLFVGLTAQANDATIPYVEVLGIQPVNLKVDQSIMISGTGTQRLFDALYFQPIHGDSGMSFISGAYSVGIYCNSEYVKPMGAEDYYTNSNCNLSVSTFGMKQLKEEAEYSDVTNILELLGPNGLMKQDGKNYGGTYGSPVVSGQFNVDSMRVSYGNVENFIPRGVLVNVYGKGAFVLNNMLQGGSLVFNTQTEQIVVSCKRDYIRPTNGEKRSDYMCSFVSR